VKFDELGVVFFLVGKIPMVLNSMGNSDDWEFIFGGVEYVDDCLCGFVVWLVELWFEGVV